MSEWGDEVIRHKYDPLPEDPPRHRKKAKRKHVRSDHKHQYEDVAVDAHSYILKKGGRFPYLYICRRCQVCGRLADSKVLNGHVDDLPDGMRLFEVKDFLDFMGMKVLPDEMEVTDDAR